MKKNGEPRVQQFFISVKHQSRQRFGHNEAVSLDSLRASMREWTTTAKIKLS